MGNDKKLEAQTQIEALVQMMGLDAPDAQGNFLYTIFADCISSLVSELSLYENIENQKQIPFDENRQQVLDNLYKNAIKAASDIITNSDPGKGASYRKDICRSIHSLLEKDRNAINQMDPSIALPLPQLMQEARTDVIDITGQEISVARGNMSSRIPVVYTDESGIERRGFFTKATHCKSKEELIQILEDKYAEYPDYKDILKKCFELMDIDEFVVNPYTFEDFSNPQQYDGIKKQILKEAGEELSNKPDFLRACYDVLKTGFSLSNNFNANNSTLNLEVGENIDSRSSAMSIVAKLLGKSNLLANSCNMKVKIGDEIIEGTFIEEAPGKDLLKISDPSDPLLTATEEQLDNPAVNKDLCDLGILDIICGNVDRHGGNIFYQFDETGKITGIKGIDNDASFPNVKVKTDKVLNQNAHPLDDDIAISEEMAAKLLSLDKDMLKYALAGTKLSATSIQYTCDRLETVQNRIKADIEYFKDKAPDYLEQKHIRVIKNDQWHLFSQKRLALRELSLSRNMLTQDRKEIGTDDVKKNPVGLVYCLDKGANYILEQQALKGNEKPVPVSFARGTMIRQDLNQIGRVRQLNLKTKAVKADLENIAKGLLYINKNLKKSTPSEYTKFEKAFSKCMGNFATRIDPGHKSKKIPKGPLSRKEIAEFSTDFQKVKDLSEKVINKLKEKQLNDEEKTLLNTVTGMKRILQQKTIEFKTTIGEKIITNKDAISSIRRNADEMQKKAMSGKKPDLKELRIALAAHKYADELSAMPVDDLFNKDLAKDKVNEYASSKPIAQRSKEIAAQEKGIAHP